MAEQTALESRLASGVEVQKVGDPAVARPDQPVFPPAFGVAAVELVVTEDEVTPAPAPEAPKDPKDPKAPKAK
jgi:hypothetical protein